MERGNKKITWKKIGGGSFRMASGRIIKPNQKFEAYDHEIPKGFRDCIIPADGQVLPKEEKYKETGEGVSKYTKKLKSVGWYNVVDQFGKVINDTGLRSDKADELIRDLQ